MKNKPKSGKGSKRIKYPIAWLPPVTKNVHLLDAGLTQVKGNRSFALGELKVSYLEGFEPLGMCEVFSKREVPLKPIKVSETPKEEERIANPLNQQEREAAKQLALKLGGVTEVWSGFGYIDVLTEEELIECKLANLHNLMHGIGQVLCYGQALARKKRIHLIGEKFTIPSDVQTVLDINDICITWGY